MAKNGLVIRPGRYTGEIDELAPAPEGFGKCEKELYSRMEKAHRLALEVWRERECPIGFADLHIGKVASAFYKTNGLSEVERKRIMKLSLKMANEITNDVSPDYFVDMACEIYQDLVSNMEKGGKK